MRVHLLGAILLASCQGRGTYVFPRPALELVVDSPVYGTFLGDAAIVVTGHVTDPDALVWVEGRAANVGTDGSFHVELPVDGPYRVVDVEAAAPGLDGRADVHLRQRIPVFSGEDPLLSWPGALTLRIGPSGLDAIAEDLGPTIDGLVGGLFPEPAEVALVPGDGGLALTVTLRGAALSFDISGFAVTLGMDEVVLGATVLPQVDADGMLSLALTDSTLLLGEPTLEAGGIDPLILEDWLDGLLADLSGTIEGVIDGLVASIGSIPLGGPIAFETDLLGTPLAVSVDALWTDPDGIGGRLGATIGSGAEPAVEIPAPSAAVGWGHADLALGVHEGLLQLLLTGELLSLLEQDLVLPGIVADIVQLSVAALPGGEDAPDADAWCIQIAPGDARAARLQGGTDPLLKLYLPNLRIELGYSSGELTCADWLVANVELAVDVAVRDGTALDIGLDVHDGAVISYATTAPWDERGVIDGLGTLLTSVISLAGGALELDLGDLLGGLGSTTTGTGAGGLLGGISPSLLTSEPMFDETGAPIDGLYALSLDLWR